MPKNKMSGATLLEEPVVQEKKVIAAVTLVLYDTLEKDILEKTNIEDIEYRPTPDSLSIFNSFLNDVCMSINFSDVLSKYVAK
jgi:hypothetical protein